MSILKKAKDHLVKFLLGNEVVPKGLFELQQYFRNYGDIQFKLEHSDDEKFVAVSQNFRFGSLIVSADSEEELRQKIQDAVLTAFSIPSSYAKEAGTHVRRMGESAEMYAAA